MRSYTWKSPSNIALVKYWGKHGIQLPANPSISFSLDNCYTETKLSLVSKDNPRLTFRFEGEDKPSFIPKLESFLERIEILVPSMKDFSFEIDSKNTFPHSSGIASSASSMSALAMCIASAHAEQHGDALNLELASELARLGSGSACRSVYGGYTIWGASKHMEGSSDRHAVPVTQIHPDFQHLQDTILLIDSGEKQVSSTVGHDLMNGHPYSDARFTQAHENIGQLLSILGTGDFMELADLMESEALTLHAMMMTSNPHFMLFKGGSVSVIRKVMKLRSQGMPISFTLDAGANVHLIYPQSFTQEAMDIIETEFVDFCQEGKYICDAIGQGPVSHD